MALVKKKLVPSLKSSQFKGWSPKNQFRLIKLNHNPKAKGYSKAFLKDSVLAIMRIKGIKLIHAIMPIFNPGMLKAQNKPDMKLNKNKCFLIKLYLSFSL